MFEFWNDLLNDKQTFLYTVLIPLFLAAVIYCMSQIFKSDEMDSLKTDVNELKRYVYSGKKKDGE